MVAWVADPKRGLIQTKSFSIAVAIELFFCFLKLLKASSLHRISSLSVADPDRGLIQIKSFSIAVAIELFFCFLKLLKASFLQD
jgi:hypothetical protein